MKPPKLASHGLSSCLGSIFGLPATQKFSLSLTNPYSLLLRRCLAGGMPRIAPWSIYLISSISRLIFSRGLTERDGTRREGEGEEGRPTDRRTNERKRERERSKRKRVRRPSDRASDQGIDAPFPLSSLHSLAPPRSFLFRPRPLALLPPSADFLSPACGSGTTRVVAWLTGRPRPLTN